jgi:hypothetical protein
MKSVLTVTVLLGCSAAAALVYAGGQVGVNDQGDGGMQAAIRFERAKAAADARQAQMESNRTQQAVPQPAVSPVGQQVGVNNQGDGSVQAAIRFEQAKAAADARQARTASEQASNNAKVGSTVGSADRSMTDHRQ